MTYTYRSVYNKIMNDESSKNRILDCALTLFSTRGYDGVGIAEICAAADITKPTLYYHFSSKEGLYKALWQEKFAPLRHSLTAAAVYRPRPEDYHHDVLPVLAGIIVVYSDFAQAQPTFFRLLSSLLFAPDGSPAIVLAREYRDFQFDLLLSLFTDIARAHGNLAGKEPLLAASFPGLIFSNISLGATSRYDAEALARQFMHGIFS